MFAPTPARSIPIGGWAATLLGLAACGANAQDLTVQLPSFDLFSLQTTVMVPDGGTMLLGWLGRSAMSGSLRGVPLFGSIPGAARGFRNGGVGGESSAGTSSVTARVLRMSEQEAAVLAEGNRRLESAPFAVPPATQRRGEFLSRHVGRGGRR